MRSRSDLKQPWRLGVLSTHPIQYHTPWFQAMHDHPRIDLEVLFAHRASATDQAKAGFGVEFDWDVPLLEGYRSRFLENRARNPGLDFWGIDLPAIGEVIDAAGFDAVLVHGWHFRGAWQARRACRKRKIPVMVRGDSQLVGQRSPLKRALKWAPYRLLVPGWDACLCVGTRSRDYFRYYGMAPDRIFEVPHVLDDRWYAEPLKRQEKEVARRQRGIPTDTFVPIFVGKLEEVKRPLDFLRAVSRMRVKDVCPVLVGDGPLRSACQRAAQKHGLPVQFLGFVNQREMPLVYSMADVLVLPSEDETWGIVVNEAMSRGLPTLVSQAVGAAPDLVLQGQTGGTFPTGDIEALAKQLEEFASSPEMRLEMGRRSRERIEQYRPESAVRGVLAALDRLREANLRKGTG